MRTYKQWVLRTLLVLVGAIISFVGFNVFIDPLWVFGHAHAWNDVQNNYDERLTKTNRITYQPFDYDRILLGNSRVNMINQNDFKRLRVYNYAVPGLEIDEIHDMIEYAKKQRGQEFQTILIGLDIAQTNTREPSERITSYFENHEDPFHIVKMLLSMDTFEHAAGNFRASIKNSHDFLRNYNRENIATVKKQTAAETETGINVIINKYQKSFSNKRYTYNEAYKETLEQWKQDNPNTQFIIFTTPLPTVTLQAIWAQGRVADYNRWLSELVDVFGEVVHFENDNSITRNHSNFYDGGHYYEHIGTMIAHRIMDVPDPTVPDDFGILLTQDNLASYLASIVP